MLQISSSARPNRPVMICKHRCPFSIAIWKLPAATQNGTVVACPRMQTSVEKNRHESVLQPLHLQSSSTLKEGQVKSCSNLERKEVKSLLTGL